MKEIIEIEEDVPRHIEGMKCVCGGYAERVDCTPEENARYGCGRSYECCSRAFVCGLCGSRLVGRAESPEME